MKSKDICALFVLYKGKGCNCVRNYKNSMSLTVKQSGVLKGMITGVVIAIGIIILGSWFNPFFYNETFNDNSQLETAIKVSLFPAIFLVASIGRLAKHRFFSSEDIDGRGHAQDTEHARILQSLLQNTLEQFCIAFIAYLAWAVIMPVEWMSVIPLAAIAFVLGRIMFFKTYIKGAQSRALGFTLSFYPSVFMLICSIVTMLWQQI